VEEDRTVCVGLDTHKATIAVAVAEPGRLGEVRFRGGGRGVQLAPAGEGGVRLSAAQLATLLEGLPWHRLQPRPVRGRARHGERKCWRLGLGSNRIAPCRWHWMIRHEITTDCCISCGR
jgi:hypothetical protein